MNILFFCPRWGSENLGWNAFFEKVKKAGYDGVEMSVPEEKNEREEVLKGMRDHDLKLIAQHWETVVADFRQHREEYERRLNGLADAGPLFINTQTGKDYYSFEQNHALLTLAKKIADESGVSILHETHRGKFSFASHIMTRYLQEIPWLKITLDISHWFNVAETFLEDQRDAVALALSRTEHIHGRIGFTEGPQVNDPRAPEWKAVMNHHVNCWDKIIDDRRREGKSFFTITPEFGAPPYLPLQPYTQEPLASQWDINVYMMEMLRERYQQRW